jgi:DNA-binding Xre family transcriptional regulator
MKVRIDEAIALYNLRREKQNKALGKPSHYKKMNKQRVGMLLYGKGDEAKYKSIAVSMNRMKTGAATSINLEFIKIICDTLWVDANFLFGFPSKYD